MVGGSLVASAQILAWNHFYLWGKFCLLFLHFPLLIVLLLLLSNLLKMSTSIFRRDWVASDMQLKCVTSSIPLEVKWTCVHLLQIVHMCHINSEQGLDWMRWRTMGRILNAFVQVQEESYLVPQISIVTAASFTTPLKNLMHLVI